MLSMMVFMQTQQTAARNQTAATDAPTLNHQPKGDRVRTQLTKRSFATLATVSPAGMPHVAGVLYELVNDTMYINTLRTSRKASNINANGQVAVCIIVRRLPVGPPSTIHFQTTAELLDLDDPDIVTLLAAGRLKSLTGHGELDLPNGCFLGVKLAPKLLTYGLGMPLRTLIKDPLDAGGRVKLEPEADAAAGDLR
ncbi:MAG: hypothetical protein ACI8Y4_003517 [Candidatus Poriferisodalaceae bacterium]|jgi:hypothetical protein